MTATSPESEELLTVEEVAPLLKVRPQWLYAAVKRGDFPHVKVGRYIRFRRVEVEQWIRQGGHTREGTDMAVREFDD